VHLHNFKEIKYLQTCSCLLGPPSLSPIILIVSACIICWHRLCMYFSCNNTKGFDVVKSMEREKAVEFEPVNYCLLQVDTIIAMHIQSKV